MENYKLAAWLIDSGYGKMKACLLVLNRDYTHTEISLFMEDRYAHRLLVHMIVFMQTPRPFVFASYNTYTDLSVDELKHANIAIYMR